MNIFGLILDLINLVDFESSTNRTIVVDVTEGI